MLKSSSTQRNSATSPLLRLPAEVRNKIFTYVNSGLNIFMWNKNFDPLRKIGGACRNPQVLIRHDASPIASYLVALPPFLALQAICRQVYNETAMLPFSTNEYWYFTNYSLDLCKTLFYEAQLQCIRFLSFTVTIHHGVFTSETGEFRVGALEGLRAFPNLQEVSFSFDTDLPEDERTPLLERPKAVLENRVKRVVFGVKVVFKRGYHDEIFDCYEDFRLHFCAQK